MKEQSTQVDVFQQNLIKEKKKKFLDDNVNYLNPAMPYETKSAADFPEKKVVIIGDGFEKKVIPEMLNSQCTLYDFKSIKKDYSIIEDRRNMVRSLYDYDLKWDYFHLYKRGLHKIN